MGELLGYPLRILVGLNGISMGFRWDFMGFHGISWDFMGFWMLCSEQHGGFQQRNGGLSSNSLGIS
jgi:hypothetical protein